MKIMRLMPTLSITFTVELPFPYLQAKEKRCIRAFPILPISCLILLDHGLASIFLATVTDILVHKRNSI